MAHIYERVVRLISKDPSQRRERDIESLIPWFQNMSGLFKAQKTDVVKDIVRNCEFRSVPADNIIIKQGDKGDCFYIILGGSVSIHINQTLEEQGNVQCPSALAKTKRKAKRRGRSNTLIKPAPRHRSLTQVNSTGKSEGISPPDGEAGMDGGRRSSLKPPGGRVRSASSNSTAEKSRSKTWAPASTYSAEEASFYHDGGEDDGEESESSEEEVTKTDSTGKLDRTMFGVHIRELGPGKSFGELALVQTNLVRTSSVIADQQTDLIVVNRDLYNRSLKAAQQQDFAEKTQFISSFPLFSHWTPRQRSVMAMSLTRVRYQYGNSLAKQGDRVRGLIFITSGRAKVSIDPIQHIEQYPNMCSRNDVQFAKEVRTGKRSRTSRPYASSDDLFSSDLWKPGPNNARRRDGYVAAEKEVNLKSVQLCTIGVYDYIGDISVLLRLPTYVATVTCLEPVATLELDLNNFERQVFKKSHSTYVTMREIAELRLGARLTRLQEEQVYSPVFEMMLTKFEDLNTPPALKAALRRKQAEEEDLMTSFFTPSWHSYREKQRMFLRRRQREKQIQEMRMQQMAHAASLGMQLRLQSMTATSDLRHNSLNALSTPSQHRLLEDALPASMRQNSSSSYPASHHQPRLVQRLVRQQQMSTNRYDQYYLPSAHPGGGPAATDRLRTQGRTEGL